jgi:hypothetical protein
MGHPWSPSVEARKTLLGSAAVAHFVIALAVLIPGSGWGTVPTPVF